jgi:LacI family transcriptional regulator
LTRRPTIIDVARLAGVSKATVARVISGDHDLVRPQTRARVMDAAAKLGYERNAVAGSLRTDQTFMVALAIPDITNPFWPEIARGVQDTIESNGYATVMVNSDWSAEREQNYLGLVRRNRFDGLIINPATVSNAELKRLNIPVVILGSGDNHPDFDAVGSASEQGALEALDYLYELGHRRIGLIAGRSQRNYGRSRYQSYLVFHARRQLPLQDELVVETNFSDEGGFRAMLQLLRLVHPPTAIFTANDILAIGALKAAKHAGLSVPEDLSIIGMDDIYAAATTSPTLTTVAKQKYETGVCAAKMLLERLANSTIEQPRRTRLPCTLIKRGTTAPPRNF